MARDLSAKDRMRIDKLVLYYKSQMYLCESFINALNKMFAGSKDLMVHVHSVRSRIKDPKHMRDKLMRKMREAKQNGLQFDVDESNLFSKINDGAGYRILHIHTRQVEQINANLKSLFEANHYPIIEKPKAKTFDDEFRKYFESIGIATEPSDSLYTSVHWVIGLNSQQPCTCEIQVRTLAEELWGEVDHALNYPNKHSDLACREQLRALAKVTASCTRLVDSIYRSHESAKERRRRATRKIRRRY